MPENHDDFYVGWMPQAPARVGRALRARTLTILGLALGAGALLALGQRPFAASRFEFGHPRSLRGFIAERPVPALLPLDPAASAAVPAGSRWWLVGPGKHGASAHVRGLDGKLVALEGTLAYRGGGTVVEIVPGSIRVDPSASRLLPPVPERLGRFRLRGEIVDSKCYLGVMNPGERKTHRACAVRCLSGGVPALFVARGADGAGSRLLLTGSDGRALNREVLDVVGEPLEVEGEVERLGLELVLRAEPSRFRRLVEGGR